MARLKVLIVGAGFGGLGMGRALKQQGIDDFLICEKSGDVGGCWRENTYPGAACDVPSHLYSFSFAPNAGWSRKYAPQSEILEYLRRCARDFGLIPHLRLNSEVRSLHYRGADEGWEAELADGQRLQADMVVTACGQLSTPVMARIPGLQAFAGPQFHSAHWDHSLDLRGRRVAVIGTGASAIQFIPQIAPLVGQLTVFQRTPPYVIAKPDRPYRRWERQLFAAVPWLQRLSRAQVYLGHELRAVAFTRWPGLMRLVRAQFLRHLQRQVPDVSLREQLTPSYPVGCKRILISNDFYPAMSRPNVALVTQAVRRVLPHGVETDDGQVHPADVLIHGTGFAATEFLTPMVVQGLQGRALHEVWKGGAEAYLGMTVAGFPNFFMLYGPNTNLGHSSIVYMLESQIRHIARLIAEMRRQGVRVIDTPSDRQARFNAGVQQAIARTVWAGGCTSWYQTADGRNPTNWPGFTFTYRWITRRATLGDYLFAG